MPSKELIDRCIVAADNSGYEKDPTAAVEIIVRATAATILAALQEQTDAIVTAYEDFMNKAGITSRPHGAKVFRAMLAASALGEQSE